MSSAMPAGSLSLPLPLSPQAWMPASGPENEKRRASFEVFQRSPDLQGCPT